MGHVVSTYFSVTFFLAKLPRPHYSARWIFWIIVYSIDFFALLFGEEGDRPAYPNGLLHPSLNLRVDGADVTIGMLAPTTTSPRPRMSATGLSPGLSARPLPTILLLTSRFVMPATLQISKYGNTGSKEARVRKHRLEGHLTDAERNNCWGMAMRDGVDVGTNLVDFPINTFPPIADMHPDMSPTGPGCLPGPTAVIAFVGGPAQPP